MPEDTGPRLDVPRIARGPQCQEPEQCPEVIFALRHPCNRFHMQRMQREDECAGPTRAGGAMKKREEQQRGERMKQDIGEIMPAWAESEEVDIQDM